LRNSRTNSGYKMYALEFSTKSKRFLERLDRKLLVRIITRLEKLRLTPVPSDAVFITRQGGDKVFRLRIGDYRALYKLKDQEKTILVTKIDKRSRVYSRV